MSDAGLYRIRGSGSQYGLKSRPHTRFRYLLKKLGLPLQFIDMVNALMYARGVLICGGAAVDATIVLLLGYTKNRTGKRDPAMSYTKKGINGSSG